MKERIKEKELKCAECGHENDPTRVFCHNCGIRLERPEGEKAVIADATPVMGRNKEKGRKKEKGQRRERVQLDFSQWKGTGAMLYRLCRSLLSLAFLAVLFALLIQGAREPDGVPEPLSPDLKKAAQLYKSVQEFAKAVYPRTIDLTEEQVNNYLASHLGAQEKSGGLPRAEFKRAFVTVETGRMRYVVEQKFLGWPVFLVIIFEPKVTPNPATGRNDVDVRLVGADVGRLSLPTLMAPLIEKQLEDVLKATSNELQVLGQADSLVFLPGVVRIGWNGSQMPGR